MRRTIFLLSIVLLIAFGVYRWDQNRRLRGRAPEKFTAAEGPRIDPKTLPVLSSLDAEYTKLTETVVPSVVSITTARRVRLNTPQVVDPFEYFFGMRRRPSERIATSLGSGVIVSKEGHILTNHHVVHGTDEIRVQLTDGRIEPAQLIGSNESVDIAVLRISAPNVQPLPFGDSDNLKVGQMVFAIGNPFGLQETVTQGIISAKGRALRDSSVEFIQTDAAVNQGNSGGPLLNLRGEIIGINSAIYSQTGGWSGISFAIPSNTAWRALESITKTGRLVRGYLGVSLMELTPGLAREFGLPDTRGALVTDVVAGSPAERAGIQAGDVLRSVANREIADATGFLRRLGAATIGEKLKIGFLRQGKPMEVTAEIAEMPAELLAAPPRSPRPSNPAPDAPSLSPDIAQGPLRGVTVAEANQALGAERGVAVVQLQPDSPAAEKLRIGDVIEEINNQPIRSVADYETILRTLNPAARAILYVNRGRVRSFVVITP